ncbi:Glutamyl-tRNAGln amidotransferase subunit A, mitochondrial [Hondaea fermentalgiana]|uniref:Glutamyl-tRNAGln amidotransferase subunit A, mitochondrial n=1 Tax=Hondaea fermentalgiana TaxID=2315210 RepID=A0A2R5G3J5_9STRA|nr:Glutamyl-tRNAGln amidotransferase subunit A, mitochondrial [Hondaea fermentalgiana]|eukprot:GBG25580.1 Glutamyl-tRNAGln amidotransferase subunit A, mitochondrial [Hondaea fermentalgiana]
MMGPRVGLLVLALALAVGLLSLVREPDVSVNDATTRVGDGAYDLEPLVSPSLTGWPLKVVTKVITASPFGPLILRLLINDMGLHMVREFAAQLPRLTPMYYPMIRIKNDEKAAIAAETLSDLELAMVQEGIPSKESSAAGYFTAYDYRRAYLAGHMDPSRAMEAVIRGVERLDPHLRMFSAFDKEDVRTQAQASAARWKAGEPLSVLDGVPVTIKDMIEVKGQPLTNGGTVVEIPDRDDEIVRRLRAKGAIILGLTVMPEGGVTPLGYNAHLDGTFNPYNVTRYSGGSSSGCAVAVASGISPICIGFDGGGSIRVPSAMSGVFGLATGFGRIPFDLGLALTTIKSGPIAASSADVAVAYAILAEDPDPEHFYAQLYDGGNGGMPPATLAGVSQTDRLDGVRIGVYWDHFRDADPEIVRSCEDALGALEALGATIVNVTIPHLRIMSMAHASKILTEFAMLWDLPYSSGNVTMEANTLITIAIGKTLTANEILAGERVRHWATDMIRGLYAEHRLDAIMSPSTGVRVPAIPADSRKIGESNNPLVLQVMKYIFTANLLGMPGMAVPVGYDSDGLPLSAHMLGLHWHEHRIMRLSFALEKHHLKRRAPPKENFFNLREELKL